MDDAPRHRGGRWSYALDWLLIMYIRMLRMFMVIIADENSATTAISLALTRVNPDSSNFSVLDLSISNPHREHPKVPLWLLITLAVLVPAVIMFIVSLWTGSASRSVHQGLLGLGVSLGLASVILNVKNLAGKPRPDFLAICVPDLDSIEASTVGGFGQSVSPLWVIVNRSICKEADYNMLNDGLRSFPSGYATGKIDQIQS